MEEDGRRLFCERKVRGWPQLRKVSTRHVMQGKRQERVSRILAESPLGIPRRADRVAHLPHNWTHGRIMDCLAVD